jgi:ParB family chromosome partitioning protein
MDKRRLGRGLDSLLGNGENGTEAIATADPSQVAVDQIQQNPYQPRKSFDEEELTRLKDSVRNHGVLQPLLVRQVGEQFQLVAGERRLRAAQAAGLASVPVRVVDFNDQQTLEAALVENIHRSDLNPIEKAHGFKEYLDRYQMNHEQMADRLGQARTTITNLLGLLELTPEVQDAVRINQITLGHAKILKGIKDPERQVALCKQIIMQGLSVHGTEQMMRTQRPEAKPETEKTPPAPPEEKTSHVRAIEDELRQRLTTKVEIRLKAKDKGQIVLSFETNDDFMRLLDYLRKG